MTFSEPVLGTATKKIKLNWWEYWIGVAKYSWNISYLGRPDGKQL